MSFFPGWSDLFPDPPITTKPIKRLLPKIATAVWYDPRPLGGFGLPVPFVAETFGASTVDVRSAGADVEGTLRRREVYGVALLDSLVKELGEPCALVLDVYKDDRLTILWSVGSARSHDRPYLVEPDQYAEQEVDVATGSATLGTVTVTIIDKPRTHGDQDSGWLTARLAELGVPNLSGRRCRLRRFISVDLGYTVIADGPAGTVKLDDSYAAFSFEIRDTRETERKVALFSAVDRSRLPNGPLEGYGFDPAGSTYLVDPATPLQGKVIAGLHPPVFPVEITIGPYNDTIPRTLSDDLFAELTSARSTAEFLDPAIIPFRANTRGIKVFWRLIGSSDPWTEISEGLQIWLFTLARMTVGPVGPTVFSILLGAEGHPELLPPLAGGGDPNIEIYVTGLIAASDVDPVYIEGLTAGQFVKNAYDGLYSVRDSRGNVMPTGIRYDEDALLSMTTPVRIRAVQVEDDMRDWIEKNVYAPQGLAPAVDRLGLISPVSQVAPLDSIGLDVIADEITEPSSDWNVGERIINILKLTYHRDYKPTDPADGKSPDYLASREILVEFRDEVSITRFGEQSLELSMEAFRAIGDPYGLPLAAGIEQEVAWQLSQLRGENLLSRYSLGAPTISVAVMRSAIPLLRAGSWVLVILSWLPDYITQRRGLVAIGQVVAIGDLDCAWRRLLIEQVVPLEPGS